MGYLLAYLLFQVFGTTAVLTGSGILTTVALHQAVYASEDELHPPSYPFKHKALLTTLDAAR